MSTPSKEVTVFGEKLTLVELSAVTGICKNTLLRHAFERDGEAWLRMRGLRGSADLKEKLAYYRKEKEKQDAYDRIHGKDLAGVRKKSAGGLSYTEKLRAMGFEPWPSDYEKELQGYK